MSGPPDDRGLPRRSEPGPAPRPLPPHLDPRGGRSRQAPSRPEPAGPHRGSRLRRVLSVVALTTSVVIVAVAALGYVLFSRYDGNIDRIPGLAQGLPGVAKPAAAPRGARNVLLVGSDTRDTTGGQFQGTGDATTVGQRSDTIILAHLYGDSDQAQLVSFPRDTWVSIPAYTDPVTGVRRPEHMDRINAAVNEGGPALLIATIERLTRIRVDNYVQIDFAGFQTMVDALGGVEVCLTAPAKEKDSGINLPAGRQVVSGDQALAFVRQRKQLPNGDIDRIRRQQAFLSSIVRQVLSSGTLLDPFKLNDFLSAATRSVKVDDSLSGAGLTSLALRLRSFSAGGVAFTTLPYTTLDGAAGGQRYLIFLDEPKAEALFEALRRDDPPGSVTPDPGAGGAAPLSAAPRTVRVSVFNGAGTAGLGRTVANDLTRAGFAVSGAPGNRGTGADATVVRYAPARAEAARTLAAAVPGSTLQVDPSLGSAVELVVGRGYRGVVPVTVGASPAPAAPAPTGPAAPAVTAADAGCVA